MTTFLCDACTAQSSGRWDLPTKTTSAANTHAYTPYTRGYTDSEKVMAAEIAGNPVRAGVYSRF